MTMTAPSVYNPLGFVMLDIILDNGRLAMATTSNGKIRKLQKTAEHLQHVCRQNLIGQDYTSVDTTYKGSPFSLSE